MTDERRRGPADEVHDDDELAAAMAAEFERYATGAVPVIHPAQPPRGPVQRPPVEPPARPPLVRAAAARPDDASFRRRPVAPPAPVVPDATATPATGPIRRRSGFLPPEPPADLPAVSAAERVLPTIPTPLPEVTVSLLDEMIAESGGEPLRRPRARHAEPQPISEIEDPLRTTGPLALPRGVYEQWEQSLRSIGRPSDDWEDDEVVSGSGADTPTVAVRVVREQEPGLGTAPVSTANVVEGRRPAAAEPMWGTDEEPEDERRPRGRRRAAEGEASGPIELTAESEELDGVDDALDDAVTTHPQVSAATTGAVDLPSLEPRPRTAPVLIERMRTAILQLPEVPLHANGSGGAALVGRWAGAFASPVVLALGFALAGSGAGPVALLTAAIGIVLALPAAARGAARLTALPGAQDSLERDVLGSVAAPVVGAVLLLARLAAAVAALLAVGDVVSAFASRTGVLGGSVSVSAVAGVLAVGLAAVLVSVWPPRVTAVLVLVFAAVGVVVSALLLLVLGTGATTVVATPSGAVAGGVAGFGVLGLLLVLVGPDLARLRTGSVRSGRVAAGTAVCAVVAVGLLVLAVRAGAGAPPGDAADAFAGAVADATAAPLALPLEVALMAASVTLPALLMRAAGGAAARLLGRGRSERLGTLAVGLLALAGAFGAVASGADPADVLLVIAATAGVPVAAWAGVLTLARFGGRASAMPGVGMLVATAGGWVLADRVGFAGERSPVLTAMGGTALWSGTPLLGLVAAFAIGAVAAGIAGLVGRRPDPVADEVTGDADIVGA